MVKWNDVLTSKTATQAVITFARGGSADALINRVNTSAQQQVGVLLSGRDTQLARRIARKALRRRQLLS